MLRIKLFWRNIFDEKLRSRIFFGKISSVLNSFPHFAFCTFNIALVNVRRRKTVLDARYCPCRWDGPPSRRVAQVKGPGRRHTLVQALFSPSPFSLLLFFGVSIVHSVDHTAAAKHLFFKGISKGYRPLPYCTRVIFLGGLDILEHIHYIS